MPFDYKKAYKEFYLPPAKPGIVTVPPARFLCVRGEGDPNEEGGAYKTAVGLLYGIAFTLKLCDKAGHPIEGYFPYVVPPLEGLWEQPGVAGFDFAHKETMCWRSLIRLPEFVTDADFAWALAEATRKKKTDFSPVELFAYDEGLCVQCMHIGRYDDEPATVEAMEAFARAEGYEPDLTEARLHHEIYLGDPRKGDPAKARTVLRHPMRRV